MPDQQWTHHLRARVVVVATVAVVIAVVAGVVAARALRDRSEQPPVAAADAPACPASWGNLVPSGSSGLSTEGRGEAIDGAVCAYAVRDGEFRLTYAASLPPAVVDEAWQAQAAAEPVPEGHDDACLGDVPEFVVVEARYVDDFGTQPLVQRAVFEMVCAGEVSLADGDDGQPQRTRMTRAGVRPWADAGIARTVHAPPDGQFLVPLLIGAEG